jgi:POT family proton-dependent oligopeptide transporter
MVDFGDLLKSKTQLVFTVILSALSLFGWYNLGWAFGLLFLFLTVIVALMMMIYKNCRLSKIKIVLFYCCLS